MNLSLARILSLILRPTDQSASLSWNKAPIWDLRPDFYYCQTVAGLLMWRPLSDEGTRLSFTIAPGPRQRSYKCLVISAMRAENRTPNSRFPRLVYAVTLLLLSVAVDIPQTVQTKSLQRCVEQAVAQQRTFILVRLFRLSAATSQY
jgi:hypothetical protein